MFPIYVSKFLWVIEQIGLDCIDLCFFFSKVLFRVALAVLKYNESQLLASTDEIEAMTVLSDFMVSVGHKTQHEKIIREPGDPLKKVTYYRL